MLLTFGILAMAAWHQAASATHSCEETITSNMIEGDFKLNEPTARECSLVFNNPNRQTIIIALEQFAGADDRSSSSYISTSASPEWTNNSRSRFVQKYYKKPDHPILTRLPVFTLSVTHKANRSTYVSGWFKFSERVVVDIGRHMPVCGPQMLTQLSGQLRIHSAQGEVHDCNWVIRVGDGRKVLLRVTELHVGEIENCVSAHSVGVYDGAADLTAPPNRQFCGLLKHHSDWRRQFISSGTDVGIRYFSRNVSEGAFAVEWNEISSPAEEGCAKGQFYCIGGKYCVDNEEQMCRYVSPFCIDRKLRCDHNRSCGFLDNSDEFRCDYDHTILAATCSAAAAVVIITMSCIVYWRRKYRKWKRHKLTATQNSKRGRRSAWVASQLDRSDSAHSNVGSLGNHLRVPDESERRKISLPASFHSKRRHSPGALRAKDHSARRASIDFNPLPMGFNNSQTYRF